MAKLTKRLAALEEALQGGPRRRRTQLPARLALDSFARLATEMQLLDAGNLHDFRKGAKKARYVAELAEQADVHAGQVGKTLKRLQDEIGDWHDWLVLAEETRTALGHGAAELLALVEGERDQHFAAAMQVAAKLRGRLMGEWLAGTQRKNGQRRRGQPKGGQRKSGQPKVGQG
jgi:CHAD domain-containing protein